VSKCEKFGYGYMVTQVAATAPGMVALQKTGQLISSRVCLLSWFVNFKKLTKILAFRGASIFYHSI